jgi:carboxypeptidase Taq
LESFEPYLDRLIESLRRLAAYKNPSADPYDVWLDEFEQGSDRAFYDAFFDRVKEAVVPLLADVSAARRKPNRREVEGTSTSVVSGIWLQTLSVLKG